MYLPMLTHPASRALHSRAWFCRTREGLYINREGHVAAARKRRHRWWVSLAPNNAKTIGRMTCHCFLQPIRTDHTSSSHTTLYRVRSSMCCLLPGYSFEPRPNSPVLGIATSAGKTSLAIKNNIDLSRSANVSNFKASTWFRQSLGFFFSSLKKKNGDSARRTLLTLFVHCLPNQSCEALLQAPRYSFLVFTKSVNSNFSAFWLASVNLEYPWLFTVLRPTLRLRLVSRNYQKTKFER